MSDTVRIELSPEAAKLIEQFGSVATWLPGVIAQTLRRENDFTIRHIQQERMQGNNGAPFPASEHKLGVRSKRLRSSLNAPPPVISGNEVISSIGTNVKYAAVHEFGFHEIVQVRPHLRKRTRIQRFDAVDKLGKRKTVRRKVRGADIAVRAHDREMDLPARAPITYGVAERMPALGDIMSRDIVRAFIERGFSPA